MSEKREYITKQEIYDELMLNIGSIKSSYSKAELRFHVVGDVFINLKNICELLELDLEGA